MYLLGNIKQENVITPWGFYFSNDYKLILYDHYKRGSISDMLHARGIAHIHTMYSDNLINGNIKASNIFLNSQEYGYISGLGLGKLINPTAPRIMWIAGYAAPEVMDTSKVSQASDVYSFGVLILELVTWISSINYRGDWENEVDNFVRWVHGMVSKEAVDVGVFDAEIIRYHNIEELEQMLQIGMSCMARIPEHRPKMSDVVKIMENA
ncbi:probable inactive receptor kinase At4g23740 [Olea europaea subsp. europaea]|uniref:Probable inactive receptor kinase At4g23740 n=1 Tax=Olea europaea subsp. europaea TaxID=158383 RepID=A0A8S0SU75_OLEEU|nr:probable inactive receptor kinase At4g23740 [Olea europaea subsp. europaea]